MIPGSGSGSGIGWKSAGVPRLEDGAGGASSGAGAKVKKKKIPVEKEKSPRQLEEEGRLKEEQQKKWDILGSLDIRQQRQLEKEWLSTFSTIQEPKEPKERRRGTFERLQDQLQDQGRSSDKEMLALQQQQQARWKIFSPKESGVGAGASDADC